MGFGGFEYEGLWDYDNLKWAVADSNAMLFDAAWFTYVCVLNSQRNYSSMLYCYFSCMVFAFGSGVVVGVMTGEPFSILHSDDFVVVYSVVWFLIFFTPLKRLARHPISETLIHGLTSVSWMRAVLSSIYFSQQMYPNSLFAVLLLATLTGSSGDLLNTLEKKAWGVSMELDLAGAKVSFVGAIIFLLVGNCGGDEATNCMVEDRTAQIIVTTYFCIWGWIVIFFHKDCNLLIPVEFLFKIIAKLLGTWYNEDYKHHTIDLRDTTPKKRRRKKKKT